MQCVNHIFFTFQRLNFFSKFIFLHDKGKGISILFPLSLFQLQFNLALEGCYSSTANWLFPSFLCCFFRIFSHIYTSSHFIMPRRLEYLIKHKKNISYHVRTYFLGTNTIRYVFFSRNPLLLSSNIFRKDKNQ